MSDVTRVRSSEKKRHVENKIKFDIYLFGKYLLSWCCSSLAFVRKSRIRIISMSDKSHDEKKISRSVFHHFFSSLLFFFFRYFHQKSFVSWRIERIDHQRLHRQRQVERIITKHSKIRPIFSFLLVLMAITCWFIDFYKKEKLKLM